MLRLTGQLNKLMSLRLLDISEILVGDIIFGVVSVGMVFKTIILDKFHQEGEHTQKREET